MVVIMNNLCIDTPCRATYLAKIIKYENNNKTDKNLFLGRGAFGSVFKATYKGKPAAVKIIDCTEHEQHSANKLNSIRNEENLLNLTHINIIKIFKSLYSALEQVGVIIMERLPGHSLQNVIDRTMIPLYHCYRITCDVISGLTYCHDNNIVHLDIKPGNIFIATGHANNSTFISHYNCKIVDFGSSVKLSHLNEHKSSMGASYINISKHKVGTLRYMAPEILRFGSITGKCDIYSMGITMWQMINRKCPFCEISNNETIAYKVVKDNLRPDSNDMRRLHYFQTKQELVIDKHYPAMGHFEHDEHITNYKINFSLPKHTYSSSSFKIISTNKQISKCQNVEFTVCDVLERFENLEDYFKNSTPKNFERDVSKRRQYKNIYSQCWHSAPAKRPDSDELLNKLRKIIVYNPTNNR